MNQKIKIGMIGAGFMGQVAHLQNFLACSDRDVVAIADVRPEMARDVANKHQIPNVFSSHRAMITQFGH